MKTEYVEVRLSDIVAHFKKGIKSSAKKVQDFSKTVLESAGDTIVFRLPVEAKKRTTKAKIASGLLILSLAASISAQSNAPLFIKGDMAIKFNTHSEAIAPGVKDVYTLNLNVANSAIFHGKIEDTPQIIDGWVSKSVTQPRSLNYDIACDVVNPKNPMQTKNVGRMYGRVPISSDGTYNYDNGSLVVDILPMGNAGGFTSKFTGVAAGKPLVRPANWLDTLQNVPVSITRQINGKVSTIQLKKYDKMDFRQLVLGAGPVQIYQPVTVGGEMLYDYDKSCWFFNNVTIQYADGGIVKVDRLTGTIRWVESPQRKSNGEGEYQFDIRINEPPADQSAAFSGPADESAFFETDTKIPGLTGTMKYKDAIRGDTTMASAVTVDLTGNNINKQQLMVICKVVIFASVVPMNSD